MVQKNVATNKQVKSNLLRLILICCGWLSITAGVIGIFLPLLPTVPFLLLAAACFGRSSERFHSWLIDHVHLGPMIRDYLTNGSIPLRAKKTAIAMVWISFPVNAFLFVRIAWIQWLLIAVAIGITFYLLALPTATNQNKDNGLEHM